MSEGGSPTRCKGLHTLHGRYPFSIASLGVEKNSTFSSLGLAGHVGRQNIPVVFTPTIKTPSKEGSLSINAW